MYMNSINVVKFVMFWYAMSDIAIVEHVWLLCSWFLRAPVDKFDLSMQ